MSESNGFWVSVWRTNQTSVYDVDSDSFEYNNNDCIDLKVIDYSTYKEVCEDAKHFQKEAKRSWKMVVQLEKEIERLKNENN